MSFKKIFFSCLILCSWVSAEPLLVDKIVAMVNDEIITLSDIQKAIELYPVFRKKDESEAAFRERILQDLIHYQVISQEHNDEFQLNEEDFEDVQTAVLKKAGSMENLIATLGRLGMSWQDFKAFIRNKVLYEKVLHDRFETKISVPYSEIEKFYNQEYLPVQKQLGIEAKSLIEMTPLIEKYLKRKKTDFELKQWLKEIKDTYKIENLLEKEDNRDQAKLKPAEGNR